MVVEVMDELFWFVWTVRVRVAAGAGVGFGSHAQEDCPAEDEKWGRADAVISCQ